MATVPFRGRNAAVESVLEGDTTSGIDCRTGYNNNNKMWTVILALAR